MREFTRVQPNPKKKSCHALMQKEEGDGRKRQ